MSAADEGVRYRDKVTIVTGGANGIGRACVELFVKHGSKVVIVDIQEDEGKEVQESVNKSGSNGQSIFVRCDISNETDVQNLIETTIANFGQIDCVINNAAYFIPPRALDELTKEEFLRLLDVNVLGSFLISKHAIKSLRKTKGNIINMTSMSGVHGQSKAMAYVVSKSGLIGMTRNLAIDEAKNGVRVNCVSPSGTDTPMFQNAFDKYPQGQKYKQLHGTHAQFMGRLCKPEEVAKACLYLATDATYSTGQNIYVSGGTELDYGFKHNMEWFFEEK